MKVSDGNTARRYHHGGLRDALLDQVEAVIRESGIEGVSLRELAKRVGVSHPAAFRHFADKRALLTAFAARAARGMAAYLDAEAAKSAGPDRFLRTGVGYLRFAMEQPGAFRAVFSEALLDPEDPDYRDALTELGERLAAGAPSADSDSQLPPAALLAWAATHGMAMLYLDGSLARDLPAGKELEAMAAALSLLSAVLRPPKPS